jgi:hypothetical protein
MGKSRKGSKNRRGRNAGYSGNKGGWETVRGHNMFRILTAVEGAAQTVVEIHPRNLQSVRLAAYADIFENYRFRKLEFTGLSCPSNEIIVGGVKVGFAYVPSELIDAFPTSWRQCTEMDHMTWALPSQTIPVHLRLPAGILAGVQKYYSTTITTDCPGSVVFASVEANGRSVADFLLCRVDFEVEFYGRTDPATTIARMKKTVAEAEDTDAMVDPVQDVWDDTSSQKGILRPPPGFLGRQTLTVNPTKVGPRTGK